ncbi:MAG: lytic transglycosylase domain-containing protein [Rhodospirillales bacterium]|nr:lytic transglycosylase domain-containing protein [Rhodospirillales bacterium]
MRARIFTRRRRQARWIRWIRRAASLSPLLVLLALPRAAHATDRDSCAKAATAAEGEYGLPAGLLAAIGRVETGRYSPSLGVVAPWPWSVDVAGTGALFPDRKEALAVARGAFAAGLRNIDLGCFQVNIGAHPTAFASLAEAMDPVANARYAARFLVSLHARLGDWAAAAAAYHSETAELGMPYLRAVLRSWSGGPAAGALPASFGTPAAPDAGWVVITPVAGPHIITPATLAAAGEKLPAVHAGWPAGLAR